MNLLQNITAILLNIVTGSALAQANYEVEKNTIRIMENDRIRVCTLDAAADYAIESYDNDALIISGNSFVRKDSLLSCAPSHLVRVSFIPDNMGLLTDVNVSRGIYVTVDFVTVQPFTWLATVAHLGSSSNLVTLPGAYLRGKSIEELRRHSFGGSGKAGSSAISPDGQYVAASGEINCREDAYPGVWDINHNKRVVTDNQHCLRLFAKH
ncbi:hypothetical protein AWB71_01665 [Caballeronia peredens]|nr:hypothetical protein AWB71_01665 [Caballeronia peredens]